MLCLLCLVYLLTIEVINYPKNSNYCNQDYPKVSSIKHWTFHMIHWHNIKVLNSAQNSIIEAINYQHFPNYFHYKKRKTGCGLVIKILLKVFNQTNLKNSYHKSSSFFSFSSWCNPMSNVLNNEMRTRENVPFIIWNRGWFFIA